MQDEVNQKESEHNEVDVDSTGEVMHLMISIVMMKMSSYVVHQQ